MKVYIVIPAYNESQEISRVINDVKKYCKNIVVVDDGSTDDTLLKLQQIKKINILHHSVNRGQGAALQTGMDYALEQGADIIVHFDSDGQMEPKEIKQMVFALIQEKLDILTGSRFLGTAHNIPFTRKLVLKGGTIFTFLFSGIKMTDPTNGFRVMTRKVAQSIKIHQDKMAHASEIADQIHKKKFKWKEKPVTVLYTEYSLGKGQSSLNCINIFLDMFFAKFIRK